jgi:integrase
LKGVKEMAKRGRNEGSIFKKANGTWRAQISIEGRRISYTAPSRAECHQWLRKMLNQMDQGMTFEGRNLTLSKYLSDWMAMKKNTLRITTSVQYEQLISKYVLPKLGKLKLKDLNLQVINKFYVSLVTDNASISRIGYVHRVLHVAFEYAVINGIFVRNPAHGATVPRVKHKEMNILNEQQVGLFLVAASNSRYQALYHLAVTTGMRISELRGLFWSDMNWIKGTISVKRQFQDIPGKGTLLGEPKTRSGIREILLGETTLNVLREQKKRIEEESNTCAGWQNKDLIFPSSVGTPFEQSHLHKDFTMVLNAANLERIRFHDLRHTAASLLLNHGVPVLVVSKILGHSNPSVTLNIYAHSSLEMQSGAACIMDEIVTPIPVNLLQLHPSAPNCTQQDNQP